MCPDIPISAADNKEFICDHSHIQKVIMPINPEVASSPKSSENEKRCADPSRTLRMKFTTPPHIARANTHA